ncbi:MAG: hypothetical protein GY832_29175 [Chloroflexi bacterium]|nr:hypothetical protein [Chloroflexota bacterium]
MLTNDSDPEEGESGTLIFNTLSMAALGLTPNGLVETDGSVVTYTPSLNFFGVDTFTYTVSDGSADGVDTATAAVTVTNTNDPPFANRDLALIFMHDEVVVLPTPGNMFKPSTLANDDDPDCRFDWGLFETVCDYGDELSIVGVGYSRYGTVALGPAGQVITYTPGPFFRVHAGDVITYTVSDGLGGTDTDIIVLMGYDYDIYLPLVVRNN